MRSEREYETGWFGPLCCALLLIFAVFSAFSLFGEMKQSTGVRLTYFGPAAVTKTVANRGIDDCSTPGKPCLPHSTDITVLESKAEPAG